jgi:release factor glutamine methyltransferase
MPQFSDDLFTFRFELIEALDILYPRPEAEMITRILLEYILGADYYLLTSSPNADWEAHQYEQASQAAVRLLRAEPIQYILGEADFLGRKFLVTPDVLIPRQETEELVDWVKGSLLGGGLVPDRIHGLDIGTGSGCIPISLELELSKWGRPSNWVATDLSEEALKIAQKNATRLRATTQFLHQDILSARHNAFWELDLITSNPPYVPEAEQAGLHPNVRDYEPGMALFVPNDDPLRYYRIIGQLALHWLRKDGMLYVEGHTDHMQKLAQLFQELGLKQVEIRKDLSNRERMLRAVRP